MGGSTLVFGDVEWNSEAGSYDGSANTCYYGDGRERVSVEPSLRLRLECWEARAAGLP